MAADKILENYTLSPKEAATLLQVSEKTLRNWTKNKYGPYTIRYGRKVKYSKNNIEDWIRLMSEQANGK